MAYPAAAQGCRHIDQLRNRKRSPHRICAPRHENYAIDSVRPISAVVATAPPLTLKILSLFLLDADTHMPMLQRLLLLP